jgi:hypothetical protein
MITRFEEKKIDYDGSQLRSQWILEKFGMRGDACVSFIGGCDVKPEYMIDLEDLHQGNEIRSQKMLHFIIEVFRNDILTSILIQRLLVYIVKEVISNKAGGDIIQRTGDDLFYKERKLSVSIATVSPISSLIHLGLNITSEDTPVPTSCLSELSIDPFKMAEEVLNKFSKEYKTIVNSILKVRLAD